MLKESKLIIIFNYEIFSFYRSPLCGCFIQIFRPHGRLLPLFGHRLTLPRRLPWLSWASGATLTNFQLYQWNYLQLDPWDKSWWWNKSWSRKSHLGVVLQRGVQWEIQVIPVIYLKLEIKPSNLRVHPEYRVRCQDYHRYCCLWNVQDDCRHRLGCHRLGYLKAAD